MEKDIFFIFNIFIEMEDEELFLLINIFITRNSTYYYYFFNEPSICFVEIELVSELKQNVLIVECELKYKSKVLKSLYLNICN